MSIHSKLHANIFHVSIDIKIYVFEASVRNRTFNSGNIFREKEAMLYIRLLRPSYKIILLQFSKDIHILT